MFILLTNDDGILAPGLAAMYDQLTALGEVAVAAPSTVQSAAGHGITVRDPLTVQRVHAHGAFNGWAIDGRPADCVKLAVSELLPRRPDLIVSGINDGANVAVDILYSGTVAAAAEGAILGVPSVAVSMEWGKEANFKGAALIAGRIVAHYAAAVTAGHEPCPLLNINVPELTDGRPRGIQVAPQSTWKYEDRYERTERADGVAQYQLGGWYDGPGPPETDLAALRQGYVVLTPLHFDRTDYERLAVVRDCAWPDVTRPDVTRPDMTRPDDPR